MLYKEGQASNFANGTRFLSKVTCLVVIELQLLYLTCRCKWGCTIDYFLFHPWLPLLKVVTLPFIYCLQHDVIRHYPAQASFHLGCACVLSGMYFFFVSLPPCLAVKPCCFPSGDLCSCLQCLSLQSISSPLHLFWAGQRQVSLQSRPVCLGILYLSYNPCHFLRGLLSSRAARGRFVVLSPLSAFLCGISSWQSPKLWQRCRMQRGYKVSVFFPLRADFDNGFYKVSCEDGLGSGFRKWNLVRRDLFKVSKVTCTRRGLSETLFLYVSPETNKGTFREKLAIFRYFTQW